MSRLLTWIVGVMVMTAAAAPASAQSAQCDRTCLRTLLRPVSDGRHQARSRLLRWSSASARRRTINTRPGTGVWKNGNRPRQDAAAIPRSCVRTGRHSTAPSRRGARQRSSPREGRESQADRSGVVLARANDPGLAGPRRQGGPPANCANPEYHGESTARSCRAAQSAVRP